MPQYAYIPLAQAGNLPNPEGYHIRLAVYVAGYPPDLIDSNGNNGTSSGISVSPLIAH
jgi:hypothetical protein